MDGKVQQAVLVHKVVLDEGLGQLAAAVDLQFPAGPFLSLATSAAASPPRSDELCQPVSSSVVEATYFGSELSLLAMGSAGSVTFGQ